MYTFLMGVHVAACLGLILFVLLQAGRGAGLQMFGGGGDSLINTPTGSSFMKKFTAGLACTFAATSLLLTLVSDRSGLSSVTSKAPRAPEPAATAPAPTAAPAAPTSQSPASPSEAKKAAPAAAAKPVKK